MIVQLTSMNRRRLASDRSSENDLMQGDDSGTWEDESGEITSFQHLDRPFFFVKKQTFLRNFENIRSNKMESSDEFIVTSMYSKSFDSSEGTYLSSDSASTSSSFNSSNIRREKILSFRHQLKLSGMKFSRYSGKNDVCSPVFTMQNFDSEYV